LGTAFRRVDVDCRCALGSSSTSYSNGEGYASASRRDEAPWRGTCALTLHNTDIISCNKPPVCIRYLLSTPLVLSPYCSALIAFSFFNLLCFNATVSQRRRPSRHRRRWQSRSNKSGGLGVHSSRTRSLRLRRLPWFMSVPLQGYSRCLGLT